MFLVTNENMGLCLCMYVFQSLKFRKAESYYSSPSCICGLIALFTISLLSHREVIVRDKDIGVFNIGGSHPWSWKPEKRSSLQLKTGANWLFLSNGCLPENE